MLCITRHLDETIEIGKSGDVLKRAIVITAIGFAKHSCRLGIEAQSDVRVVRGEIARAWRNDRTNPQFKAQATGNMTDGDTQGREVQVGETGQGQDAQEGVEAHV